MGNLRLPDGKRVAVVLTTDVVRPMSVVRRRGARKRIFGHLAARPILFKALHRISLSPDRIGDIVAGALVLLQQEHQRTT